MGMHGIGAGQQAASTGDIVVGRAVGDLVEARTDASPPDLSLFCPRYASKLSTDPPPFVHGPRGDHPQSCPQMWVEAWRPVHPG